MKKLAFVTVVVFLSSLGGILGESFTCMNNYTECTEGGCSGEEYTATQCNIQCVRATGVKSIKCGYPGGSGDPGSEG